MTDDPQLPRPSRSPIWALAALTAVLGVALTAVYAYVNEERLLRPDRLPVLLPTGHEVVQSFIPVCRAKRFQDCPEDKTGRENFFWLIKASGDPRELAATTARAAAAQGFHTQFKRTHDIIGPVAPWDGQGRPQVFITLGIPSSLAADSDVAESIAYTVTMFPVFHVPESALAPNERIPQCLARYKPCLAQH